ncbi:MAG: tetratricopeptide repeat protein [Candidatus Aminicenantes bacterium]|nr:tetratricopeptide repeat protein [Candidatus Aminicenantes bacterium]
MKKKELILFLLFTAVQVLPAQQRFTMEEGETSKFKMARQLYERGKQLLAGESYDRAEKAFKDCLEIFPKFSYARYYLSQLYYYRKDYVTALALVEKAKEDYEFISDYWVKFQLQYLDMLRQEKMGLEEKIRDIKDIIAAKNYKARTPEEQIAEQMDLEGQQSGAELELREADEKIKNTIPTAPEMAANFYFLHGNILFKLKKYNGAYAQYLEAVRVNPAFGNAYNNLANLNFMGRRYKEALFYLEKAEKCGAAVNPKFKKDVLQALGD